MAIDRAALAEMIDHTLLRPEATAGDVEALCAEAAELGVVAVCVSPSLVAVAHRAIGSASPLRLASVCGFPSGAHQPATKAAEAALAASQGAHEIDVVIDLGLAKAAQWAAVEHELTVVRRAVPEPTLLKVIIESAALHDHEVVQACRVAVAAGADFVKTSTGFHPTGGATTAAVALMRETVGPAVGVKASGGIRTAEAAVAMVDAGATRIGCSASAAILAGLGS